MVHALLEGGEVGILHLDRRHHPELDGLDFIEVLWIKRQREQPRVDWQEIK